MYEHTSGAAAAVETPDWDPLIDLVGLELVRWFMWMSAIELPTA